MVIVERYKYVVERASLVPRPLKGGLGMRLIESVNNRYSDTLYTSIAVQGDEH